MFYIKAQDELDLWSSLEAAGLAKKVYAEFDEDGNGIGEFEWQRVGQYDLDIIGVIYKPTGKMLQSEEGYQYPEMAPLDGYHANLRVHNGDLTDEQKAALPLIPAPATPSRIWAGD